MGLVVEDGSVVVGANALASASAVAAYLAQRGVLYDVLTAPVTSFAGDAAIGDGLGDQVASLLPAIVEVIGTGGVNDGWHFVTTAAGDEVELSDWTDVADSAVAGWLMIHARDGWWDASKRKLEGSIVAATDFLAGLPWAGSQVLAGHTVAWPRTGAWATATGSLYAIGDLIPSDAVPSVITAAVAELAAEHIRKPLDLVVDMADVLSSKRIGPIAKTWADPGAGRTLPAVQRLLRGLLDTSNSFGAGWATVAPGY